MRGNFFSAEEKLNLHFEDVKGKNIIIFNLLKKKSENVKEIAVGLEFPDLSLKEITNLKDYLNEKEVEYIAGTLSFSSAYCKMYQRKSEENLRAWKLLFHIFVYLQKAHNIFIPFSIIKNIEDFLGMSKLMTAIGQIRLLENNAKEVFNEINLFISEECKTDLILHALKIGKEDIGDLLHTGIPVSSVQALENIYKEYIKKNSTSNSTRAVIEKAFNYEYKLAKMFLKAAKMRGKLQKYNFFLLESFIEIAPLTQLEKYFLEKFKIESFASNFINSALLVNQSYYEIVDGMAKKIKAQFNKLSYDYNSQNELEENAKAYKVLAIKHLEALTCAKLKNFNLETSTFKAPKLILELANKPKTIEAHTNKQYPNKPIKVRYFDDIIKDNNYKIKSLAINNIIVEKHRNKLTKTIHLCFYFPEYYTQIVHSICENLTKEKVAFKYELITRKERKSHAIAFLNSFKNFDPLDFEDIKRRPLHDCLSLMIRELDKNNIRVDLNTLKKISSIIVGKDLVRPVYESVCEARAFGDRDALSELINEGDGDFLERIAGLLIKNGNFDNAEFICKSLKKSMIHPPLEKWIKIIDMLIQINDLSPGSQVDKERKSFLLQYEKFSKYIKHGTQEDKIRNEKNKADLLRALFRPRVTQGYDLDRCFTSLDEGSILINAAEIIFANRKLGLFDSFISIFKSGR